MSPSWSLVALLSILSFSQQVAQASPVDRRGLDLQSRNEVDACEQVLLGLKATSLCSSYNGVRDSTKTATSTKCKTKTVTVPAAACTITAPGSTLTSTSTTTALGPVVSKTVTIAQVTTTTTLTPPVVVITINTTNVAATIYKTQTSTTTLTVTTTTTRAPATKRSAAADPAKDVVEARAYVEACTKKGLPAKVTPYGCSAISKACSRIAQPKTITAITTVPGNTKYSTVTAPKQCNTITAPKKIVSVTTTVTNGPSTQTATVTPPVITSTVTNPALNATVTVTITPAPVLNFTTVTTTATTTTTTTALSAPQCTGGAAQGAGSFSFGYNTYCNAVCTPQGPTNVLLSYSDQATFQACINNCDNNAVITLVNYDESTGTCECRFVGGNMIQSNQSGKDCAVAQGSGVSGS